MRRSFGRHACLFLVVALVCLLPTPLFGLGGRAVEGFDRSRLLPPVGAEIGDYENTGYRLRARDGEIHIEVETGALRSTAPYAPPREAQPGSVGRLAQALVTGSTTHFDASSRILGWVARNLEYHLDRQAPQGPEEVLERRTAYCTGVARLTVALLEAVGIEAREVPGYVLEGRSPAGGSGYHRWVEIHLPDRGWVFSDPLTSHHYVPATYVRLASEHLTLGDDAKGLLIERQDHLSAVDVYPAAVPGVTARRNWDRQLAATLRVEVEAEGAGTAMLVGKDAHRVHALVDGATTFVGLDPGSYELRLVLARGVTVKRRVELEGRVRKALHLPLSAFAEKASSADEGRSSGSEAARSEER